MYKRFITSPSRRYSQGRYRTTNFSFFNSINAFVKKFKKITFLSTFKKKLKKTIFYYFEHFYVSSFCFYNFNDC